MIQSPTDLANLLGRHKDATVQTIVTRSPIWDTPLLWLVLSGHALGRMDPSTDQGTGVKFAGCGTTMHFGSVFPSDLRGHERTGESSMKGVQFLVDDNGNKTAVLIDLKRERGTLGGFLRPCGVPRPQVGTPGNARGREATLANGEVPNQWMSMESSSRGSFTHTVLPLSPCPIRQICVSSRTVWLRLLRACHFTLTRGRTARVAAASSVAKITLPRASSWYEAEANSSHLPEQKQSIGRRDGSGRPVPDDRI